MAPAKLLMEGENWIMEP